MILSSLCWSFTALTINLGVIYLVVFGGQPNSINGAGNEIIFCFSSILYLESKCPGTQPNYSNT